MYKAEIRGNDLVFRRASDGSKQFSVDVGRFVPFCGIIKKQILPNTLSGAEMDGHSFLFHMHLKSNAAFIARFSALEEAKRMMGNSMLQHDLEYRQRIDVTDFAYDDFAKRSHDFVRIRAFCHNYPLFPSSRLDKDVFKKRLLTLATTKGNEEQGGLVKVFDMKALGFNAGDAPRDHFDVWVTDMLILPEALEHIEDKGAYRVIYPKAEYFPKSLRGDAHKALREIATPETMETLKTCFMPIKPAAPKSTL